MNTNNYNLKSLHILRGLAALYVLIGHARWLLWEGYAAYLKHSNSYTIIEKICLYVLSGFRYGHQAVILFIVLSGFVIHLKNAELLKTNPTHKVRVLPFYVHRFIRIYPTYLLAIIVTYFLDLFGTNKGYFIYDSRTNYDLINSCIKSNVTVENMIDNLLFFGGILSPVWGSNGPIWSLSFEWWFYVFYPIILFTHKTNKWLPIFLVITLFFMSIFINIESSVFLFLRQVFSLMICWWLGVFLAEIYVGKIQLKLRFVYFFSVAFLFLPIVDSDLFCDILVSIGLLGVIGVLISLEPKLYMGHMLFKTLFFLGNISFSVYIIHMPILVFLSGFLMNRNNGSLPQSQIYIIMGVLISILAAIFVYYVSERPSQKLRKNIVLNKIIKKTYGYFGN